MADKFDTLESILEPELEKGKSNSGRKPKIFPDPIVPLKRIESTKISKADSTETKQQSDGDLIMALVKKGNAEKTRFEPHTCSLCEKVLKNRDNLKSHLLTVHGIAPKLFCDLCPKTFRGRTQINQHIRSHRKKTFACNICDYKAVYKCYLIAHKKIHLLQERCKICNKQVASLKAHMLHHKKDPCVVCGKELNRSSMIRHMKEAHDEGRCKCTDCNFTSGSKEILRRHKLEQHYKGKLYRCHCGSFYKSNGELNFHQSCHKSEKITCTVCKQILAHPHSFKAHWRRAHLKTHGPVKVEESLKKPKVLRQIGPFICDKCGFTFQSRSLCLNHFREKHLNKPLFCDLCPKSFMQKYMLKNHILLCHFKQIMFTCDVCNYKSGFKQGFGRHMLLHCAKTQCKICLKMVTNINEHMRTHVGKKSYHDAKCTDCNFSAPSKKVLRRHKLENHYEGQLLRCHCGSVFKRMGDLNNHQSCHKDKKVTCEVCMKKLANRRSLRSHWKAVHLKTHGPIRTGTTLKNTKSPRFSEASKCDKCGSTLQRPKSFNASNKQLTTKHRLICNLCPKLSVLLKGLQIFN